MAPERHLTAWDDFILRLIAVYHLLKASFFFALGLGLLKLLHHDIAKMLNDYLIEPFNFNPDGRFLKWVLEQLATLTPHSLRLISYLFFCYGLIFAVEGVGLYLRKRWAEYMVAIVVSSLLPFEFYELHLSLTWWKILLVMGNIAVVVFLVHRIRVENADRPDRAVIAP